MIRAVFSTGLIVFSLAGSALVLARDEPPVARDARADAWERARAEVARLQGECARLGDDVKEMEALREGYEAIRAAGKRAMSQIKMPGGGLMFDRVQELGRQIQARKSADPRAESDPSYRALVEEHSALHDRYTGMMNQVILSEGALASAVSLTLLYIWRFWS